MVVVTGASGHVGAFVVRDLLARGEQVRVFLQEGAPTPGLDGLPVERVMGDVRDPASLRAAFSGMEVVYHLAAVISIDGDAGGLVEAVNVGGARNAAEAALACRVRRMVHVSSVHAFDHHPLDRPLDEGRGPSGPKHPAYDRSKAAGEAAVLRVGTQGLDVVVLSPTGILGPLDFAPSHSGAALLRYAHGGVPLAPDGGFDWVDVRDVARSIVAAAERGRAGERYLLSGHWASAMELGQLTERLLGVRAPLATVPLSLLALLAPAAVALSGLFGKRALFTPDSIHALRSNRDIRSDKAKRELGHTSRPLLHTLRDTFSWFGERGLLPAPAAQRVALVAE